MIMNQKLPQPLSLPWRLLLVTAAVVMLAASPGLAGRDAADTTESAPGSTEASQVTFELRLVSEVPREGFTVAIHTGSDRPFFISDEVALSNMDVEDAKIMVSDDTPQIMIHFNEQGTAKFADLTRTHISERLGILVNGELVSAPVIKEEVREGRAMIQGKMTLEDAQRIVRGLKVKSPPEQPADE